MQLLTLQDAGLSDDDVYSYEREKVERELARHRGESVTSPPPPEKILRFKLFNRGKVAATHMVGWLYFEWNWRCQRSNK